MNCERNSFRILSRINSEFSAEFVQSKTCSLLILSRIISNSEQDLFYKSVATFVWNLVQDLLRISMQVSLRIQNRFFYEFRAGFAPNSDKGLFKISRIHSNTSTGLAQDLEQGSLRARFFQNTEESLLKILMVDQNLEFNLFYTEEKSQLKDFRKVRFNGFELLRILSRICSVS